MRFEFIVSAEVERTQGKFASRDEIEEQIQEALDSANPDSIEGGEGGEYEVSDWVVEAQTPKGIRAPKVSETDRLNALVQALQTRVADLQSQLKQANKQLAERLVIE